MSDKFPLALPEGAVLAGQYIVEKVLGQGGFGITYKATDHKTGAKVAVKEFFPDAMATRTGQTTVVPFTGERGESYAYGKACFLQEAETLAQFIGNENIVRIHSYFEENGTAYFVMDFIEGTSFDEYLKQRGGKVSFEEAAKILIPVMDALGAVHSKGIVHRDVTPDNIYITKEGVVKLLDFGAARYSLGDKSRSLDVVLKHGFAPKEQYARRGKQGSFTDVYSLGATFYFALTGKRPPDSIERMDEDDLVPPSALGVQLSRAAEDAILLALSVQPADRFQSMAAFKNAMLNVVQGEASQPQSVPESASAVAQTFFSAPAQGNIPNTGQIPQAPVMTGGAIPPSGQPTAGSQLTGGVAGSPQPAGVDAGGKKAPRKKGLLVGIAVAVPVLLVGILVLVLTGRKAEPTGSSTKDSQESVSVAKEEDTQSGNGASTPFPTTEPTPAPTAEPTPTPTAEPTPTPTAESDPEGDYYVWGNSPRNLMNGGSCATMGGLDYYITDNYKALVSFDASSGTREYIYQDQKNAFSDLSAQDGKLYFLYGNAAYVYDLEVKDSESIDVLNDSYSGHIKSLYVLQDYYVIYCDDLNVYRVSKADGESKVCCTVEDSFRFTLSDNGWIYYVEPNADGQSTIRRKRLDTLEEGGHSIHNSDTNCQFLSPNIVGDYLYVCSWNQTSAYACNIVRFSKEINIDDGYVEWNAGSALKDMNIEDGESYGTFLNVYPYNGDMYFGVGVTHTDDTGFDASTYFFQIKGNEDGTFTPVFLNQNLYGPCILSYKSGAYDVFFTYVTADENGNLNSELVYWNLDADGNLKSNE